MIVLAKAMASTYHLKAPMTASNIDRAALSADLDRVRQDFHHLMHTVGDDEWDKPTTATSWTNEQYARPRIRVPAGHRRRPRHGARCSRATSSRIGRQALRG
ncbi:hypothetical protein [Nocardia sp. NPDC052112]|uniref:hypothetical protein n=1 Tax=Nocardia sp. NPDC052112 TaxID=3155646 RepID=UPI003414C4C7